MDGVVYTKDWVVNLMLDMAGYTADVDLARHVIVEPSCGCGAFLSEIVRRLLKSARERGKLSASEIDGCIRAFDIDPYAVGESRKLVVSLLEQAGFTAVDARKVAETWVTVGDALLVDYPAADWVVGNPPYVRSSRVERDKRQAYAERLSCVTMGTDLYVGFFEKGLNALKPNGKLCFICADRWLQNRYGAKLRKKVSAEFQLHTLVKMNGVAVFEDEVSAYPAITLIGRGGSSTQYAMCSEGFTAHDAVGLLDYLRGEGGCPAHVRACTLGALPSDGSPWPLAEPEVLDMVLEYARILPKLEDCGVEIGIGVASGCDDVYITKDPTLVERDRLLPLFFMRDWRAGLPQERYLVNPWNERGELVDLSAYPKLQKYLSENEGKLRERRVAKDHPSSWYRTLDKPNSKLSGSAMLLFPDMASSSDPVLSDGSRYPHHNCYWLTSSSWDLSALGGLLMSDIVEAFIEAYGVKMRGQTLRFQAQYLRMVHIPRCEDVPSGIMEELSSAFKANDRQAANRAARRAYECAREAA